MQARLKTLREAGIAVVTQVITDIETIGSGGAAGGIRGHFEGKYEMDGKGQTYAIGAKAQLSPELLVGGFFKVVGYSGLGGKGTEHLHALGNGPLTFLAGFKARDHFYASAKGLDSYKSVGAASRRELDPGAIRDAINKRREAARQSAQR